MAPKSVTFRRHDHLVSVLFEDLLSHSYNITFSMFLDLVIIVSHETFTQKFLFLLPGNTTCMFGCSLRLTEMGIPGSQYS